MSHLGDENHLWSLTVGPTEKRLWLPLCCNVPVSMRSTGCPAGAPPVKPLRFLRSKVALKVRPFPTRALETAGEPSSAILLMNHCVRLSEPGGTVMNAVITPEPLLCTLMTSGVALASRMRGARYSRAGNSAAGSSPTIGDANEVCSGRRVA